MHLVPSTNKQNNVDDNVDVEKICKLAMY